MQQAAWTYMVPIAVAAVGFVGVVFGALAQQIVDVWKTGKAHRHELQRRLFDAKFKVATEVSIALYAGAQLLRARLAEAEEWTRGDNRYDVLSTRQQMLDAHGEAFTQGFRETERAFALMEFLFEPAVWLQHATVPVAALEEVWREFDEKRYAFKLALNDLLPDQRVAELSAQRQRGVLEAGVHEELERWFVFYHAGLEELRAMIPRLREVTDAYDVGTHRAIQALRAQFQRYAE